MMPTVGYFDSYLDVAPGMSGAKSLSVLIASEKYLAELPPAPAPPLTDREKDLLRVWVAKGALP